MADTEQYQDHAPEVGELRWIPIDRIDPATDNPRTTLTGIDELAASITALGILSPVVVEEAGKRFTLVAGARRHAAAVKAGLAELPALVRRFEEPQTRKVAMLSENDQRIGLTPLEEAAAYAEVLALPGVEPEAFARQLGRPVAEVDGRLALLRLPRAVRKLLSSGALAYAEALLLTELSENPEDVTAALKQHARGWEMTQAVSHVRTERERLTRTETTRAALEAKGVRIVDDPGPSFGRGSAIRRLGSGYGAVHVKHSVHRKEPCHAAAIGWDGSAVYVCTEPKRHAGEEGSGIEVEPDLKAKRAATRAANHARRAATTARTAKVRALLTSGDLVDVDYVCRALVQGADRDDAKAAAALLQLAVDDETGLAWDRERDVLRTYAAIDVEHARRAALALQLAAAERDASAEHERWGSGAAVIAYLDFLAAAGYEDLPGDIAVRDRYRRIAQEVA